MKKSSLKFLALAACSLAFAGLACAAGIDGKWKAEFDTQIGMQKYVFDLKADGEKLTGKASFERGDQKGDLDLKEGKIAMWHTGIWMFNVLATEPANWDIAVEPGNTQKASHFFANAAVASATTPHAVAAAKWLQFLAGSDETVKQRLEGEWELPAVFDDSLLAPYLAKTPPASRQVVFDALLTRYSYQVARTTADPQRRRL